MPIPEKLNYTPRAQQPGLPPPTEASLINPYEFPLYTYDELEKLWVYTEEGARRRPSVDVLCGGLMRLPLDRMRNGLTFFVPRGLTTLRTGATSVRYVSVAIERALKGYQDALWRHIAEQRLETQPGFMPFFKVEAASGASRDSRRENNWMVTLIDPTQTNAKFGPTQAERPRYVLSEDYFPYILGEIAPTPPAFVVPQEQASHLASIMRSLGFLRQQGAKIITAPYGEGTGVWIVGGLEHRKV